MGLRNYIIRRFLIIIPLLIGISFITFSILRVAPGDPITTLYGAANPQVPQYVLERIKVKMGLDKPLWMQYIIWLKGMITGNFGFSYVNGKPVIELIKARIWNTMKLALSSLLFSVGLSVLLGSISAIKRGSIFDYVCSIGSLFGISMPSYWIGLIAILIFSLRLGWFPTIGVRTLGANLSATERIVDEISHMVLPTVILGLGSLAFQTRLMRASMLQILGQDYIRTARAKGLKERKVIYKHVLRNALLPVVTLVGLQIGFIMSGSVLVETIFAWPGIGRLIIEAAKSRDYSVIMGINMIISTMVLFANLFTDIIYAYLDPRIKY